MDVVGHLLGVINNIFSFAFRRVCFLCMSHLCMFAYVSYVEVPMSHVLYVCICGVCRRVRVYHDKG